MNRITGIVLTMLIIVLSFNCSKRMTEQQQQYVQQQRVIKEKIRDSIMAQNEASKSDSYKDYIVYFNNGKDAHNSGSYAQAIELFDACLNLKSDFAEAWGMRGLSKFKSGDNQGACSDWMKSVELGASNFQSLVNSNCN